MTKPVSLEGSEELLRRGAGERGSGHGFDPRIGSTVTLQEAPYISCTPSATTRAASTTATTRPCAGARLAGTSTMILGESSRPRDPCPVPAAALP